MIRYLVLAGALVASAASAQEAAAPSGSAPSRSAEVLRRYSAPEARQGVAVDRDHVYAVANSTIAKYDKKTGMKVAEWKGDPARYPHINSCAVISRELVCASSNFPAVPQTSSVEFFDPATMTHLRTVALGLGTGSITWIDRKDGAWWAAFANYDGKGGEAPRDHRHTALVRFDDQWRKTQSWSFPQSILDRFKPMSSSGGGWGPDGRLYITGHDHPELYILALPKGGSVLDHVGTISVPVEGQAIDWDESQPGVLYGISRPNREMLAMRVLPAK
ncbi:MAG: hypothetical protein V4514_15895 [Pseudomonadota bacterium]|uniref:hypothetical protein n=1 Tax=unclassified Phenylobacterium TaxID=2640670 RepID=UPI0006FECF03|nr:MULTISPECIES: hypothetical protein [unclassified Phenylobacterium]KRB52149.1 hypothetical protein ASE02_13520 [Phenylobacterium sp. Root700]